MSNESQDEQISELYDYFNGPDRSQYENFWFERGGGPGLSLLVNENLAWLMYLKYEGDAGFSTRNPDYSGDETATLDFELDNGQTDDYPLKWVIPLEKALKAAEYFILTGEKDPKLEWHDDGEPG